MTSATGNVVDAQSAFNQVQQQTLINKAQKGCKTSFQALYHEHVGRVYALCYRLTGDKSLAEDATQEVFIQLWRKIGNYSAQSKFSTWLHSVAANVTVSYMRKQKGWFQRMFNIEDSTEANSAIAEASGGDVDLESYIVRLPERARMVFVLHAIEGYRHEDIADLLEMAVGSSKAQFHRAKQLLKEWMGDDSE